MRDHHEEIHQAGANILVVAQARPEALSTFLADEPCPFPVVTDPERAAYRAFGLERTSWWRIFRPKSVLGYLRLIFGGWGVRRPTGDEDVLQLGGDFLLDAQSRLVFAYRSADPIDRPTVEMLLLAIKALSQ